MEPRIWPTQRLVRQLGRAGEAAIELEIEAEAADSGHGDAEVRQKTLTEFNVEVEQFVGTIRDAQGRLNRVAQTTRREEQ